MGSPVWLLQVCWNRFQQLRKANGTIYEGIQMAHPTKHKADMLYTRLVVQVALCVCAVVGCCCVALDDVFNMLLMQARERSSENWLLDSIAIALWSSAVNQHAYIHGNHAPLDYESRRITDCLAREPCLCKLIAALCVAVAGIKNPDFEIRG